MVRAHDEHYPQVHGIVGERENPLVVIDSELLIILVATRRSPVYFPRS